MANWINEEVETLIRDAIHCHDCPHRNESPRYLPQPRWIGPLYDESISRILIIMLNPGTGKDYYNPKDEILENYKNNSASLEDYFNDQKKYMKEWGNGGFLYHYESMLGLELDKIAFANIAWCATKNNQYHTGMLDRCFEKYTRKLIKILAPKIVLLSGVKTWKYKEDIIKDCGNSTIIPMWHYANRKSRCDNTAHTNDIRRQIERMNNKLRLTTG